MHREWGPPEGARHEEDFQLGGDAGAVGDALGGDEARQRLRVLLHARSRQHHSPAAGKRVEQLLRHPARAISMLWRSTEAGSSDSREGVRPPQEICRVEDAHDLCCAQPAEDVADQGHTWTEASKLMGAFCRKASAGVSFSLLHKVEELSQDVPLSILGAYSGPCIQGAKEACFLTSAGYRLGPA